MRDWLIGVLNEKGIHVGAGALEALQRVPLVEQGLNKAAHLSMACQKCKFREMCGGGYLPHRYDAREDNFNRPTIYCADMMHLCQYILDDVGRELKPFLLMQQHSHNELQETESSVR